MSSASPPAEVSEVHSRLLKCALELDEARAYWRHCDGTRPPSAHDAFEHYWFGARSLPRIESLLLNLRARFDAFPPALAVLHRWPDMGAEARKVLCHVHLQLADPLYRAFTGTCLVERGEGARPEIARDAVVAWVGAHAPAHWTLPTRIKFASKLLSAAHAAGLIATVRDPRALVGLQALSKTPKKGCGAFDNDDCNECLRELLGKTIGELEAKATRP